MIASGWMNLIVLMKNFLLNPSLIAQKFNIMILDVNFTLKKKTLSIIPCIIEKGDELIMNEEFYSQF
jgi:hypothetical protein